MLDEFPIAEELQTAIAYWIIAEKQVIRKSKGYEERKNPLKHFKAESNILRVRGRFGNTNWDKNVKHPMLIGGVERHFTILLVRFGHKKVAHSGVEATLNWLRTKYWITKERKTVKQSLMKCITCKGFNARTLLPSETPDLPSFRVDDSFSFCNVGVNFCGSLTVRSLANKDSTSKVYILLVTCASSRAVHLVLVPFLTSAAFICAFTRFVSRKALPKLVISDTAKTFRSLDTKRFVARHGITQRFILLATPWQDGFYECFVRSVKLSLRKSLGKSFLLYEELMPSRSC